MDLFFRCKKCYFPNTKPSLHFDEKKICFACKYTDYYEQEINWDEKLQNFYDLCKEIKKNKTSDYDCIIPVSGGKDSTYQTHLITKIGELKPLLVSFEPSFPTEVGEYNLNNLSHSFDCDLIQLKKSKETYKKLAKIGFDVVGDHEWPNHVGIFAWPIQIALMHNIKVLFYGESQGLIGLGRWDKLVNQRLIDREWVEEHCGMNGLRLTDILEFDKTIKKEDVIPYSYPDEKLLNKKKIRPLFTGNYFHWDHQKIIDIIEKEYSWKRADKPTDGDYANFEDIDCGFMPIHQYFKFIKYGYGRATDHASYEIRHGRMTKQEAKKLIANHEGKIPRTYFKEFLDFLNISEEYFIKIRNKFTNPVLFKKDNNQELMMDKNGELILEDDWLNSFN
jgi:N-acetyl sugar amidotransferase